MWSSRLLTLAGLGLFACADPDAPLPDPSTPGGGEVEFVDPFAPAPLASGGVLAGPCEASDLAAWGDGWLVADNEEGEQLYGFDGRFSPGTLYPLTEEIGDIEALAAEGDGVWVVGSQSTTADGEVKAQRSRVLRPDGELVTLDVTACARCEAMRGVPAEQGGLNVEGAAWLGERLWLGVRSPLSDAGDAYVLAATRDGRVDTVLELDLYGDGVRALAPDGDGLLIVAGPASHGDAAHALWRLDPLDAAPARLRVPLPPSTEGAAVDPADPDVLVYVTDGAGEPTDCSEPATWGRVELPR